MKFLIFTPFAQPTGAERMLWYFIKNADRTKFSFAVYSTSSGTLLRELPEDVPYFVKEEVRKDPSFFRRLYHKVKNKFIFFTTGRYPKIAPPPNQILDIHAHIRPDVWYINTVQLGHVAELAASHSIPFITHFHDLLYIYKYVSYSHLKTITEKSNLLIGCAECVCEKLKIMGGKTVALQYECTDVELIRSNQLPKQELRAKYGIKPDAFVWVMPGSIEHRKGIDFIPQIARYFHDNVQILCLGESKDGYGYYVEKEIEYLQLSNVRIAGFQSADYTDYLRLADGLLLSSREDPFPLVMIEAAAAGLPIVAFNSGGVKEFVREGMGIVIATFEVEALVDAMQQVMESKVNIDPAVLVSRALEFDYRKQVKLWEEMMYSYFELK